MNPETKTNSSRPESQQDTYSEELTTFLDAVGRMAENPNTEDDSHYQKDQVIHALIDFTHAPDFNLARIRALQLVDEIEATHHDKSLDVHILPNLVSSEIYEDEAGRAAIDSILDRKVRDQSIPLEERARIVQQVVGHEYGEPIDWIKDPSAFPPYITKLTEDSQFGNLLLNPDKMIRVGSEVRQVDERDLDHAFKTAETVLDNFAMLPSSIKSDLFRSLAMRFKAVKDTDGNWKHRPGSEPIDGWTIRDLLTAAARITQYAKELGPDILSSLHDTFGIVNYDRYPLEALKNTQGVIDGDPQIVEGLKKGEITLSIADAFKDHNNAFGNVQLAKDPAQLIVSEVRQASDFYRPFVRLKHLNISPSTIVLHAHGQPGRMHFGNPHGSEFVLRAVLDTHSEIGQDLPISEAQIDRLTEEYMEPDSEGVKRIILRSCSQAKKIGRFKPSTAQVLSRKTRRGDNVIITATEVPTNIKRTESGEHKYSDRPAIEHTKSLLGRVARKESEIIRT